MILIKLGGSVITDKRTPLAARLDVMERLAAEIKNSNEEVIIVHGGGSFGHIKAAEHRIKEGYTGPEQSLGISCVQADMRQLNSLVVDAFRKAGMAVASLPAGAVSVFDNGELAEFPVDVLTHYLDIGITPITFGDVVIDRTLGVTICSGDDIMLYLAEHLDVDNCIFVTEVDGLFENFPPKEGEGAIPLITRGMTVNFNSANTDVTGGMERKLELMFEIASHGSRACIVNGLVPGRLADALGGKEFVGTIVSAGAEEV